MPRYFDDIAGSLLLHRPAHDRSLEEYRVPDSDHPDPYSESADHPLITGGYLEHFMTHKIGFPLFEKKTR